MNTLSGYKSTSVVFEKVFDLHKDLVVTLDYNLSSSHRFAEPLTQVGFGGAYALARDVYGVLYIWPNSIASVGYDAVSALPGINDFGQDNGGVLLFTTYTNTVSFRGFSTTPIITGFPPALSTTPVLDIACGYQHAYALLSDGTLTGWGNNHLSALNTPTFASSVQKVEARQQTTTVLLESGRLSAWGGSTLSPLISALPNTNKVVDFSIGYYHGLALLNTGVLTGWGTDIASIVPSDLPPIIDFFAGDNVSLVVTESNTVTGWGLGLSSIDTSIFTSMTGMKRVVGERGVIICTRLDNTLVAYGSAEASVATAFGVTQTTVIDNMPRAFTIDNTIKGITLGILPYFRVAPEGHSASDGSGYSDVSGLSARVSGTVYDLSASGIKDAQIGVCLSIDGSFGSKNTGVSGINYPSNNSIIVRGSADRDYPLVGYTSNLLPFTLYSPNSAEIRRVRTRFTDFGKQIIVDGKISTEIYFNQLANIETEDDLYRYGRLYVSYVSNNSAARLNIANINVNGYDVTLYYVYSGADYLGLSANPAALLEGQTLSAYNEFYSNTTLLTAYSSLGTLVTVGSGGAPYVNEDGLIYITYE